ncbi:MAG: hypothetical protein KKB25_00740 [Nanoarchaeota archaeon]|nr:hypothetical protein [Nanoarchaeota archaeon]
MLCKNPAIWNEKQKSGRLQKAENCGASESRQSAAKRKISVPAVVSHFLIQDFLAAKFLQRWLNKAR